MNIYVRLVLLLCLIFTSASLSFSQTGSIKGIVFDSTKNEYFNGVNITVEGIKNGTSSNKSGAFILDNLKPGTYNIQFTHTGYGKVTLLNITVKTNDTVDAGIISMKTAAFEKTGATVSVKRKGNSEKQAVQDVKKADQVVSAMSGTEAAKIQAPNVAAMAARIPGVTLMESRFIMLRGLSQRYNSVQINGINAPSTEVDRRAFSFDLVPSNMVDKILIYKSGAPELAGDFAGGVIKVYTKNDVEKDFLNVGIGFGFRRNTTFLTHQNNNAGGGTDLLGFDNGARALPESFPNTLAGQPNNFAILYGKEFKNNYQLSASQSPLDFGASISFGKNFKFGKKAKLFTINNIGYSTNYQYATMHRYRYQYDASAVDSVRQVFNYTDENYSVESKINLLSNWILNISKKSTLTFKNMFNQIGENETTIRTGTNPTERPNTEFRNYGFHYMSRSIYSGQLELNQRLNTMGDKLNLVAGFSSVKRNEPDYRRFRTYRTEGSDEAYTLIDPPSSNLFDAARFYSYLNEHTVSGTVNYEKNFKTRLDSVKNIVVRTGAYVETKSRDFSARWFGYVYNGQGTLKDDFLKQPIDQIFNPENMNSAAGWRPSEGTNPQDRYVAQNKLAAAYIGTTIPMNATNISFGVRAENFIQTLNSATQSDTIMVKLNNLNFLPSLNISRYLTEKALVRLAYSRTVNRPEFRELAPFVYYDFVYDVNIVGNPKLKSATINNLDVRYEVYPSSSETVSFGVFYKNFLNPIENYVQPIGLSPQYTLQNATKATNFGAELEIRKSLDNMTQDRFLKNLSIVVNASYIYSKVDLGNSSTLSQDRTRALQGQSPYIINAALFYNNEKKAFNMNLAYNIFGKRIAYVGNKMFPTVYEMPRHSIDLTMNKEINKKLTLKFGVGDILNFKHRLWQDSNRDGKINYHKAGTSEADHELLEFRRGQTINFSLSFKIL